MDNTPLPVTDTQTHLGVIITSNLKNSTAIEENSKNALNKF